MIELEHVNLTVGDAKSTADTICNLFDWRIRWQGGGKGDKGHSIHVGSADSYIVLYTPHDGSGATSTNGRLNHVAVVVDDLDEVEAKVKAAGFEPKNHGDYEPGKRFYFDDDNGIEFEVVSYA